MSVQAAQAEIDAEALKHGVVSGSASATVPNNGNEVRLGALPLLIRQNISDGVSAAGNKSIAAEVWSVEQANELSPVGLVFTIKQTGDLVNASGESAALQLTVDYSQIPMLYGGSFKSRLTLYRVDQCVEPIAMVTSNETAPCQSWQALGGANDLQSQRLTMALAW